MSQSKPPAILNPTYLKESDASYKKYENPLKKTLNKTNIRMTETSQNYISGRNLNFDQINFKDTRRTASWAKPTQQKKNHIVDENKFSDEDTECGNISYRKDSRSSFHNCNEFQNINKVYNSTNSLAEEFRNMIKKDREQFLQEYNKIENTLINLMEALKQ